MFGNIFGRSSSDVSATNTSGTASGSSQPAVNASVAPPSHKTFGDKLRGLATSAQSAVTAYASSPTDATSGRSGLATKFSNVRRRINESVMESFGSAKPSEDTEYEAKKAAFLAYESQLQDLRKHVVSFVDAARAMCFACSQVGDDADRIFTAVTDTNKVAVDRYQSAMKSFDGRFRVASDIAIVNEILDPIDARFRDIQGIHEAMRERELCKVDYDARTRTVANLKQHGSGGDPQTLLHKEAKLAHTHDTLVNLTTALYHRFEEQERSRYQFVSPLLTRFADIQRSFFQEGMQMANALPRIEVTSPAPLDTLLAAPHGDEPAARKLPALPQGEQAVAGGFASAQAMPPAPGLPERVRALYEYTASNADELSLAVGDVVTITGKHADGWWSGRNEAGAEGVFPSNFVAPAPAASTAGAPV